MYLVFKDQIGAVANCVRGSLTRVIYPHAPQRDTQKNSPRTLLFRLDGNALFLRCRAGKIKHTFSYASSPFFNSPFAALRYI